MKMCRSRAFSPPGLRSKMGDRRGFTLVEIMISCTISVFVMIVFLTLLSATRSAWFTSQVQSDLYLNGRKAVQTIFREIVEASSGCTEKFTFTDPINGQWREGLWFASGRGDPGVAGEDGSLTNDYVHLKADHYVGWRSVVVISPYVTPEGDFQLRRYVDYGPSTTYYSGTNIFPLTFSSVTPNYITFMQSDGTTVSFDRTGGTVLANYLASEDANNNATSSDLPDANEKDGMASLPPDNADNLLNYGINFIKVPGEGKVDIILFLSRQVRSMNQAGRFLVSTVRQTVKLRQP